MIQMFRCSSYLMNPEPASDDVWSEESGPATTIQFNHWECNLCFINWSGFLLPPTRLPPIAGLSHWSLITSLYYYALELSALAKIWTADRTDKFIGSLNSTILLTRHWQHSAEFKNLGNLEPNVGENTNKYESKRN